MGCVLFISQTNERVFSLRLLAKNTWRMLKYVATDNVMVPMSYHLKGDLGNYDAMNVQEYTFSDMGNIGGQ